MLTSTEKLSLFLQIGNSFKGQKQLPSQPFVVVCRKELILSGNPIWRRLESNVCFIIDTLVFQKAIHMLKAHYLVYILCIERVISIRCNLLQSKSNNVRTARGKLLTSTCSQTIGVNVDIKYLEFISPELIFLNINHVISPIFFQRMRGKEKKQPLPTWLQME